jgi:predicted phosphodiesterase
LKCLGDCLAIGRPFYAVLGNNDLGLDLPEKLTLEQHGRSFCLIHIPPRHLPACDFLLHGHTHVPRDERVGDCRILNPGSIGKANKGAPASWAWLEIGSRGVRWKINLL